MTNLVLDAARYLLMAKLIGQMRSNVHRIFWEILRDNITDWTVYLPALAVTIRGEKDPVVLAALSSLPLRATLSTETVKWRLGLAADWEKRLEKAREDLNSRKYLLWKDEYISSLRGLRQMDTCGILPGTTCPSVLPTLLNEARYICKEIKSTQRFECLAALSSWRPAPNIVTDPTVLKAWGEFWLELYQKNDPDDPIIMKGISAKALLNLRETAGKDETMVPTDMEPLLLKSLTKVAKFAEMGECLSDLLDWQPQDVTRFPADSLVKLPEALLKRFSFLCQIPGSWENGNMQRILFVISEKLVRWDRAGLLTACGIDLLPRIVPNLSGYLNNCLNNQARSSDFLNRELCWWLIRDKVANVGGGRQILRELEKHWQYECSPACDDRDSRFIAWKGRIQLHRSKLATEVPTIFHKDILEAIEREKSGEVRLALFLWSPGKDVPERVQMDWERLREKGLESDNKEISRTSAVSLLSPNPDDDTVDPVVRWQKLRNVIRILPKKICPKLSIAEVTQMPGEYPVGNPNTATRADASESWQFRTDETRFRVPTEPVTPISTPATVQTVSTNRTGQRSPGGEEHPGRGCG